MQMSRISQIVLFVAVALGLLVMISLFAQAGIRQISLSSLMGYVANGAVEKVEFHPAAGLIKGDFMEKSEPAGTYGTRKFSAAYNPHSADDVVTLLREHNVTFEYVNPSFW